MASNLEAAFKAGRVPCVPAIWSSDDTGRRAYVGLSAVSYLPDLIRIGEEIRLTEAGGDNQLGWTSIGTERGPGCSDLALNLRAEVGGGALEEDGLVALFELSTGAMRWLAFFEDSNAFVEARFAGNALVATTELRQEWVFPIDDPLAVQIRLLPPVQ